MDENLGQVTFQAKLYNLIKQLDPYHLVTGAVQCHNLWMWSDVPAYPPHGLAPAEAQAYRSGSCVPSVGSQPPLQLSLDLIMAENYGQQLISHAGDGTVAHGTALDGSFRNGLTFEPIVNCHGLWADQRTSAGVFGDHPSAPEATRSALWLAIVTANMISELVFILQPVGPTGWENAVTRGGGWLQTVQIPIWAEQVRWLLPSFLRPFEAGAHPAINVSSARLLRPTAATSGLPGSDASPIRAGAWEEAPCPTPCLHIIAVNVLQDTPVAFTVELESPSGCVQWRSH